MVAGEVWLVFARRTHRQTCPWGSHSGSSPGGLSLSASGGFGGGDALVSFFPWKESSVRFGAFLRLYPVKAKLIRWHQRGALWFVPLATDEQGQVGAARSHSPREAGCGGRRVDPGRGPRPQWGCGLCV